MKLIIDIPKDKYEWIQKKVYPNYIDNAIRNGIPLKDMLDMSDDPYYIRLGVFEDDIDEAPTVETQAASWEVYETLHGEWEGTQKFKCSACGYKAGVFNSYYCPECGAKMKEGKSWKHE